MVTVSEINHIEQLAGFRLLWKSLWQKTRRASFFQTLEWLEQYWQSFGQGQKLRVLIVSIAGRPIGIVPLVVKSVASGVGQVRVLTYPLDSWGAYYGQIGPNPAATLVSAMRHVREARRDWDLIDLRYVDRDGVDRGRTPNALAACGLGRVERIWQQTAIVDVDTSWDEYWSSRSPSLRTAYEDAERKLAAAGRIDYQRHRPDGSAYTETDPRWDLFFAYRRMTDGCHQASRKSSANRKSTEFLRRVHQAAVRAGAADLNLLTIDAEPVACIYNYQQAGHVETVDFIQQQSVSPAVGCVLMGRMLRDSFERGDRSYTFSQPALKRVSGWETDIKASARYTHFSRTDPRAQLLRLNRVLPASVENFRHWSGWVAVLRRRGGVG